MPAIDASLPDDSQHFPSAAGAKDFDFPCLACGYHFTRSDNLSRHWRVKGICWTYHNGIILNTFDRLTFELRALVFAQRLAIEQLGLHPAHTGRLLRLLRAYAERLQS